MSETAFTNDLTLMYVAHDAMRRDLEEIARIGAATTDDPRDVLQAALGWEMFTRFLQVHHGAEDDVLWPFIRQAAADRPDHLAVIDAMEAEHAVVDPGLAAVDAALADRESGPERLGGILAGLVGGLGRHLEHEEQEALAIIDLYATPEVLHRFGAAHRDRVGADTVRFLPWMLDGADEHAHALLLGRLPEPVRRAYAAEWRPGYAASNRWNR